MRLPLLLLTLLSLLIPTLAARSKATSFCKCICFNNSTIIALNPSSSASPTHNALLLRSPHPQTSSSDAPAENNDKPKHPLSCTDCNRAFCLSYNLPICKNAGEEDVFTTCFQRDSLKDETVVVVFLIATAGLLIWALVKPWVDRAREARYSGIPTLPDFSRAGRGGFGGGAGAAVDEQGMGSQRVERPRDNGEGT